MNSSHDTSRYTVGWIAPMSLELTAGLQLLEDRTTIERPGDDVKYNAGRIGPHFVVMVVCPRVGNEPASTVLANMRRSFPSIKHVLVVGIAGGVPAYGPNLEDQIVLGDVVVGVPHHGSGGVVHYEFGSWEGNNEFSVRSRTLHPSAALLTAVNHLRSAHMMERGSKIPQYLSELRMGLKKKWRQLYEDPGAENDHLFDDDYVHEYRNLTCEVRCDTARSLRRVDRGPEAERETDEPEIHYGTIGSANAVVRSSARRNELRATHKIICVEMEAAGVMSDYQGLVIRGICDYADSHKNDGWQHYAAATAAAYAKGLSCFSHQANGRRRSLKKENREGTRFITLGLGL
ncbi:pfs domain-containing protein [Sordaria brevicollis]|uniref:Pfs domain-containing protein n=1 Tax=Sordaria brevicollis TaxID=83679 RepID=A0AAE0UG95_SORBR|nr:pfs domain-containing protein [Sordaria brevicollis]